ncbi:hypothetical protein ACWD4G_32040 [Streptomyces sp. NPDC002643]
MADSLSPPGSVMVSYFYFANDIARQLRTATATQRQATSPSS